MGEEESALSAQERERLAQLLADSLDVLESEDTLELLVAVCRQGLAHLLDRVADHYSISPLPYSKASNSTESDSDSGFVSPAQSPFLWPGCYLSLLSSWKRRVVSH